jgi:glycosyltransferase involved in cell wall biosynthesis
MRYVWDQYASYFGPGRAPLAIRAAMRVIAPRLRTWDAATAARPTAFVASSENARNRIRRHYGRDVAAVVYPPVDVDRFRPAPRRDDFYLSVGALVPYKRLDIAVDAFRRTGRRLVIAGDGPDRDRLARRAGRTIEFAGRLDDAAVADLMARCRAFVMPGEEDFGIAPVEAQAAGAPVIALAKGGSLETVAGVRGEEERPDATGVFFDQPTPDALIGAIEVFEKRAFDPAALHVNARRFAPDRFRCGMRAQLDALLAG